MQLNKIPTGVTHFLIRASKTFDSNNILYAGFRICVRHVETKP